MRTTLRRPRPRQRRGRPLLLLIGVCCVAGCTTSLDFERARRMLRRDPAPVLPQIQAGAPTANLPIPERLRATSGELRQVPLKWDPILVGDVGGYQIERASDREGPFDPLVALAGALTTTYIDDLDDEEVHEPTGPEQESEIDEVAPTPQTDRSPAADGGTRFYRVRGFTPSGQLAVDASEVAAATTAPVPSPPENLRAYSHQPRRVPLSWSASSDHTVAGYRVYRSPTSLGPFEMVGEREGRHATTFSDERLGDLRVFYYQVTARNAGGGEGVPTDPVRVVTKPEPLPPMGLRVVGQRLGANELAWDPNVEPDITQYRLLRQRDGAPAPEIVSTVPQDSFTTVDAAVGAGEKIRYSLVAFDSDGLESGPGDPISVTSEGYELRAAAGSEGVVVTWNPRTDEGFRGARIFRGGIFGTREFPPVSGPRFVDADVRPGRSYRYSVSLTGAGGRLAPRSASVEVEVPKAD